MKKYVMLVVATIMMVGLTVAQQPGPGRGQRGPKGPGGREDIKKEQKMEMSPQAMVNHLAKEVELTDVQKADLLKHFEKQALKREEMKKEFKKQQEKLAAERVAAELEVEKIIGVEKFKKLQVQRMERLQKMNRMLMMKMHKKEGKPARR